MSNKIMPWIDVLPNVETTDFQARRDEIAATVSKGAELLNQGKQKESEAARAQAYFASCKLEGDAKAHWSMQEVEQAKVRIGW
nr:KleA protein [uncultured bacterium]